MGTRNGIMYLGVHRILRKYGNYCKDVFFFLTFNCLLAYIQFLIILILMLHPLFFLIKINNEAFDFSLKKSCFFSFVASFSKNIHVLFRNCLVILFKFLDNEFFLNLKISTKLVFIFNLRCVKTKKNKSNLLNWHRNNEVNTYNPRKCSMISLLITATRN